MKTEEYLGLFHSLLYTGSNVQTLEIFVAANDDPHVAMYR